MAGTGRRKSQSSSGKGPPKKRRPKSRLDVNRLLIDMQNNLIFEQWVQIHKGRISPYRLLVKAGASPKMAKKIAPSIQRLARERVLHGQAVEGARSILLQEINRIPQNQRQRFRDAVNALAQASKDHRITGEGGKYRPEVVRAVRDIMEIARPEMAITDIKKIMRKFLLNIVATVDLGKKGKKISMAEGDAVIRAVGYMLSSAYPAWF